MIKKVRFPDSTEQEIQDSRIDGIANTTTVSIDSTPTSGSGNLVTSGGVKTAVDAKQDTLVSGTNIKTVNSESLLGSGNIGVVSAIGTSGNNLTYTKNGTTSNVTVPYATKADKDGSGTSIRYSYFRQGLVYSPAVGNFPRLYSTQTNNAFYALDKRKTVTATGFTAFTASTLFNNNSNTLVNYIPAGGTGVITIGATTDANFTTYTYGNIYLQFYIESSKGAPTSVSIRAYGTKGGVVGWYNYNSAGNVTDGSGNLISSLVYCGNTNIYNIKSWEITIVAHETLPTYLSEVIAIFTRSNGEVDQSAVTKFANAQTLYGEITIDNTLTATGAITGESIKKSGGTSSQFLKADGSVDSTQYATASALGNKQDTLVSGTNIKTVNNQSLLGSGNITIEGGSSVQSDWEEDDTTDPSYIQNKPDDLVHYDYVGSTPQVTVPTYEVAENKVTSLSSSSTNTQYPSAKCAYDAINPSVATSQPSGGMLPNIFYRLGTLSGNTTFTLATPVDSNIANHYFWSFETGSTAPTITWPSSITSWVGGSAPGINASKHYEISVLDGIAVCMEV